MLSELQFKAATDPEFRAAVLADPRAALAAANIVIPDDVRIRVVESTPEDLVLAIPPAVPSDAELSEEALAGVSGGITFLLTFVAAGAVPGFAIGAGVGAIVNATS